ncbi:response regulator [Pedobacter chinensis]|uniref:Response regulator n=1 Tax=Pedobacter chinensis TaxID=2282421 RepID=A0A369Q0U4_9SPHI|nr:response regulator [Pedobacter chinensis]RDC55958.1 response regulator [Pedobacter chinensis]
MKKNASRPIALTNQLLELRKAEADKLSLSLVSTNINELLHEIYASFKPVAEQKDLECELYLPKLKLYALVDCEVLKKIITNLFSNAIEYASRTTQIKLLPFSSDDDCFGIEFRHDGHIFSNEDTESIFEPDFRITETEQQEGTGIGFSLAKSLTELHKGKIEFKKMGDHFNIFLLSIPIHQEIKTDQKKTQEEKKPDHIKEDHAKQEISSGKPFILLVEDHHDILTYLKNQLANNYVVFTATNGMEAIDILEKENIQLIISDIMMPVMDGIDLCKNLKNDLHYSHIPVILLTAKNSIGSKIEGLEVGADAYIEKPFAFEHLLAQINNLLINRNIIKEHFAHSPLAHIKGIAHSKADQEFITKLHDLIFNHITQIDLDVDLLAKMMNMSRPTLYRKVKAIANLSPNEFINVTRLKRAAEVLAEGNYKINEVANMVGYTLSTNFSRDFQRQFGLSPSTYLNTIKKEM